MSEPSPPGISPPRQPLSTAAAVLLFLAGAVLLLPGLCAVSFVVIYTSSRSAPPEGVIVLLWIVCLAISAGGIVMITRALRR